MWSKEENEQLKENILEYCKVRELEIGGRWVVLNWLVP